MISNAPYVGYVYSIHLRGDSARKVPRTRCGQDLTMHTALPVTDNMAEVNCGSCQRLFSQYGPK